MLYLKWVSKWAELHLYLFSFAKFGTQIPLLRVNGKSSRKCKCDTVHTLYIRVRVRKYDKKPPFASKLQEPPWIQAPDQTAANASVLCSAQWRKHRITWAGDKCTPPPAETDGGPCQQYNQTTRPLGPGNKNLNGPHQISLTIWEQFSDKKPVHGCPDKVDALMQDAF